MTGGWWWVNPKPLYTAKLSKLQQLRAPNNDTLSEGIMEERSARRSKHAQERETFSCARRGPRKSEFQRTLMKDTRDKPGLDKLESENEVKDTRGSGSSLKIFRLLLGQCSTWKEKIIVN